MARRFNWVGAQRISQIPEDIWVVVASWGPLIRDEFYEYTVRGVVVNPLESDRRADSRGVVYRWCIFPGNRKMLVNEGNLHRRRVGKYDAKQATSSGH